MKNTPFKRLWLPVSVFKQRYGKGKCFAIHPMLSKFATPCLSLFKSVIKTAMLLAEVGPTMIPAFQELFGKSHRDCRLQDLPELAESAREAPGTWVTAQCQHRWLLIARALQGHDRSRKSALNNDTELWSMLARVTDSVGLLFEGVPHTNCNLRVHSKHGFRACTIKLNSWLNASYWVAFQQVAI